MLLIKSLSSINVENYISLKRGVYRLGSTYKTAKMIYQKDSHSAEVDSCSVKETENSLAYIPAFNHVCMVQRVGPKDAVDCES